MVSNERLTDRVATLRSQPMKADATADATAASGVVQFAPIPPLPASEGLSRELEALLDLVRQSPNPLTAAEAAGAIGSTAHDVMLQSLLASTSASAQLGSGSPGLSAFKSLPHPAPEESGAGQAALAVALTGTALAKTGAKLPSAWYEPAVAVPEPWYGSELRAGVLGLGLGVLIIIPLAMMSGSWLRQDRGAAREPANRPAISDRSTDRTGPLAEPNIDMATVRREPVVAVAQVAPGAAMHPLVQDAQRMIEQGDVAAARSTLSDPGLAGRAEAQFVLAETFDPNVLAAWGTRGVVADVEKARAHYQVAQGLGHAGARERLRSLQ